MANHSRTKLSKRSYRFFADPSHGWLRVPMADIVALRIEDKISQCSYVRDSIAYLEEDCDASAFIAAYTAAFGQRPKITEAPTANNASRILGYVGWNRHNALLNAELRRQRDQQTNALPVFETRLAKIQEGSGQYATPITSTQIACETLPGLLRDYFADRLDCEEFAIVTLDTKHRPTRVVRITRGTLDASLVYPREVFRAAIASSASCVLWFDIVRHWPSVQFCDYTKIRSRFDAYLAGELSTNDALKFSRHEKHHSATIASYLRRGENPLNRSLVRVFAQIDPTFAGREANPIRLLPARAIE